MTITLSAELNDAQPTMNPNRTVQKVTEQLAGAKKLADGTSTTKRTSQIVYTAKAPLEPALRGAVVLSVKLREGQDPHSLKAPAPSVAVTEAAAPAGTAPKE